MYSAGFSARCKESLTATVRTTVNVSVAAHLVFQTASQRLSALLSLGLNDLERKEHKIGRRVQVAPPGMQALCLPGATNSSLLSPLYSLLSSPLSLGDGIHRHGVLIPRSLILGIVLNGRHVLEVW